MGSVPGIVVVDATFLRHLYRPASVAELEKVLRASHLMITPSVPNVVEALKHPRTDVRTALLDGIRRWTAGNVLNPWPLELLRLSGEALRRGETEFSIHGRNADLLINHPEELQRDHEKAVAFLTTLEETFAEPYRTNRKEFQDTLKAEGLHGKWPTLKDFLDDQWSDLNVLTDTAEILWDLAGLDEPALSVEMLWKSEIWRLALDALGAVTYQRAVRRDEQKNPAGFVDLFQLLYLGRHTRARIFVTDDNSLYDAATGILRGRYPNVRVMRGSDFLPPAA